MKRSVQGILGVLRPPEGWRAFAGEVGVVLLGVLLALGAQEIAEDIEDRREAAATRESLASEIRESLAQAGDSSRSGR